jgi:hypothetical protein
MAHARAGEPGGESYPAKVRVCTSRHCNTPQHGSNVELVVTGSPGTMTAPAESLPSSITVDLEDEAVPAETVLTEGSRTLWSSAPIRGGLLPGRVVAVRLTPRGDVSVRVLRFAVRA